MYLLPILIYERLEVYKQNQANGYEKRDRKGDYWKSRGSRGVAVLNFLLYCLVRICILLGNKRHRRTEEEKKKSLGNYNIDHLI